VDQIEYGDFLKYCFGKLPCDKPLKIYWLIIHLIHKKIFRQV
jgi:hypothetical protein